VRAAVVGAGSWGTALAAQLARAGHDVRVWARRAEVAAEIERGSNSAYLPGVALPALSATNDLASAAAGATLVAVVVPSEFGREAFAALRGRLAAGAVVVSAIKGLELDSLRRMSEVAAEELGAHPLAVLSGPSFAAEVASGQPTTVVIASASPGVAEGVQRAISTRTFRAYSSEDVAGVELGGALKNVIAIAAGIVDGLGYGHNTVAALITRGLAEMTRLSVALGGRPDTLAGLAGLGDLVLTCTGGLSRNRAFGQALGRGQSVREALEGRRTVVEGFRTTAAACALAARAGTEMPIATLMKSVLYEGRDPREAIGTLMSRTLKKE
jgi:glycerol-3-phosphate dehydrogenase (NAD(P)+)